MGRPRITDGKPLAIRLPKALRVRLEALQAGLVPGLRVDLSQVIRTALELGAAQLEASIRKGDS